MKKINLMLLAILVLSIAIIAGCSKTSNDDTKTVKTENTTASNKGKKLSVVASESKLEWIGKKVTGQHNGTVDIKKGEIFLDNGKLTGGNFEFDFTTIKVIDLTDTASNAKLTGHLKSDDFFSVASHPIGKFEIKSASLVSDGAGNNYKLSGNLTIKGITKEVTFPAKVNIAGDVVTASADFNIDRTLWDIKFRSAKFFENLGDNLINDDFNIKFNIVAK